MVRDQYHYALKLERQDHTPLGQFPIAMDWGPAHEWARFMALRVNADAEQFPSGTATILPDWHDALHEPYVGGLRVVLEDNGEVGRTTSLPLAYFRKTAVKTSSELVTRKLLEPKEEFLYSVVAFRNVRAEPPRRGLSLTVEETASAVALKRASHRELYGSATAFGDLDAADVAVFIPQRVLDHAGALTQAAGAGETAGILIGHLCRDPEQKEIFVEVTDLIPAKHTVSESTQVTFTAETWTAVEGALRLRRGSEIMLGWFHSHPAKYWCSAKCPPEARRTCPLSRSFFSGDDCTLHRTVFPMAHSIALVVTNTDAGLRHALFGWRQGLIEQRGFHVVDATPGLMEAGPGEAIVGDSHEEACT